MPVHGVLCRLSWRHYHQLAYRVRVGRFFSSSPCSSSPSFSRSCAMRDIGGNRISDLQWNMFVPWLARNY